MSNQTTALAERGARDYRLPTTAVPSRYEIRLTPDLDKFAFEGEETIHVDVITTTCKLVLNAAELDIHAASVVDQSGRESAGEVSLDADTERLTISFPAALEPGSFKLKVRFSGILNDKLHGFYRSKYKDEAGQEKTIATTQFEATDARRAFPCWDEPEYKAVFKITLVVDSGLTAISNSAVIAETPIAGGSKKSVEFADTIKMSTYLVAFIVGEFEGTEAVLADRTPIRIWCVPGKVHLTDFARDCAVAATRFFADYYGIPYPGDKMDLIAIPDFASGAMENLGAITFRETALLVDGKTASHAEKERVADVVAHEIAHMWFGDLVTMKWWNGLWLNEAFATFMEMLAVDNWQPQWKRWDSFGVSRAAAFAVDGLKSTRPIEFPVHHPDEAGAMFDVLTYEKGASVLRMLEQYLGPEAFRKGIAAYLKKHEYANAETTDLWDAIEKSSRQPVRSMMDSWIFQGGHPIITAELSKNGEGIVLSQERFLYLSEDGGDSVLFHVPVMLRAKTDRGLVHRKVLLKDRTMEVDFGGKTEYVVVNEGGHGFYRSRYSPGLAKLLIDGLYEKLAPIERFNLIADSWASTVSGKTSLAEYLRLALEFRQETDKNVWAILAGSLHYISRLIGTDNRDGFEAYVRALTEPAMTRLGLSPAEGEDDLTRQLRGMILGVAGVLGNCQKTQKQAADLYARYKKDANAADPNVVPALISILAFTGAEERYEEFWRESQEAKTPQEEQRYLFALAAFRKAELLEKTLARTTSGAVRTQNAPYLVQSLMNNVYGREIAWSFLKGQWETLVRLFPENSVPRMCEGVTSLVTPQLEAEVVEFFKTHPVKQGGKTIDQHMEKLRVAVRMKEREEQSFPTCFQC